MSLYPRERISEALRDSANRGIAVIVAPAGFGKTEAASDAFGEEAAWVDVPAEDGSAETFARALISKAAPRSLRAFSALLSRPDTDQNRAHLAEWCASRLRAVEQPIILDDFQHACSAEPTMRFVRAVIEMTVPNVRWVIISRETPELPIGTWLARDYMTLPIAAEDLAFEVAECSRVAAASGIEIDPDSLAELANDVGGWPLAVRLSLGSWQRTRALPAMRIRTRAILFDYIESQIWSTLGDYEQQFFEAAAYLNELRPRILGAAGFEDARLTLERLNQRLPLLSRGGNGSFRLHELFREYITQRNSSDYERTIALVIRLAKALERFGDVDGAIALYVRAETWEHAIALLSRHGTDRIENGHRAEIGALLRRFPSGYRDHPVVMGLRGFILAVEGAYQAARREIENALTGQLNQSLRGILQLQLSTIIVNAGRPLEAIPYLRALMVDEHVDAPTRLSASALLATASAMAGETAIARDAIGFCAHALDAGSSETRAVVNHRLAFAHWILGEPLVAEGYASECVQLAHSMGLDGLAARGYSVLLAVASSIYSDTLLARRYADACTLSAVAAGDRVMQVYGLECQLAIAVDQGDDELYDVTERKLAEFGADRGARNLMWLHFAKVIRAGGLGNFALCNRLLSAVDGSKLSPAERVFRDALQGLLLAAVDRDEALRLLGRPILVIADQDYESQRLLAYGQVFHALAQWLVGRGRAARRAPSPDLSAVTARDASLLVVIGTICSTSRQTITPTQLAQLTEPLIALDLAGHARFLRMVLAPAAITPLTRTELEVLRELRAGGTTADVADRLGKSSHTILSHLKSACSKIGCSGRAAAVAYAHEMGWID